MKIKYFNSGEIDSININSNTKLILRSGAIVSFSSDASKDFIVNSNNDKKSLFYSTCGSNIQFIGEVGGVINGRGSSWGMKDESVRPGIIEFSNCQNIKIKDLVLIDSPRWGIRLINCKNVEIDNVNIISKWGVSNNGIIIDSCQNIKISNCAFDTENDCISLKTTLKENCENIQIINCTFSSDWSAFKIGTESIGDFNNISFSNCVVKKSDGCVVKIVPTDGGRVSNVLISDIVVNQGTGPLFIANGTRNASYNDEINISNSSVSDVVINNFTANVIVNDSPLFGEKGDCVLISGNTSERIKNVTIQNSVFNMPGGRKIQKGYELSELADEYPEYYTLGVSPAAGIYLRHVDHVTIKNVVINLKDSDNREKIILDDVEYVNSNVPFSKKNKK